jgi:hypothetical protein
MQVGDNAAANMANFTSTVKKTQQSASTPAPNQGVQSADPDKDGDNEATETAKAANAEAGRGTNVDTTA